MPTDEPFASRDDSWPTYRLFVIAELKELKFDIRELNSKVDTLRNDINTKLDVIKSDVYILKTKAAIIGALAGGLIFALSKALDFFAHK